jgi:hypothetical protein
VTAHQQCIQQVEESMYGYESGESMAVHYTGATLCQINVRLASSLQGKGGRIYSFI